MPVDEGLEIEQDGYLVFRHGNVVCLQDRGDYTATIDLADIDTVIGLLRRFKGEHDAAGAGQGGLMQSDCIASGTFKAVLTRHNGASFVNVHLESEKLGSAHDALSFAELSENGAERLFKELFEKQGDAAGNGQD